MRKVDKILQGVPFYPKKVLVWQLAKDVSQSEIINRAKELGYIIDTRGDTRISRSNVTPILIFKNQYPYKSVNSLDEASCVTKVPKATILRMIASPLLSKEDKRNGGRTTPEGCGFDYLA
jgi:hypothetical protein